MSIFGKKKKEKVLENVVVAKDIETDKKPETDKTEQTKEITTKVEVVKDNTEATITAEDTNKDGRMDKVTATIKGNANIILFLLGIGAGFAINHFLKW